MVKIFTILQEPIIQSQSQPFDWTQFLPSFLGDFHTDMQKIAFIMVVMIFLLGLFKILTRPRGEK